MRKQYLTFSFFIVCFLLAPSLFAKKVKVKSFPPHFVYYNSNDKKINLRNYRDFKPVVLSFFATYCKPCRREIPFLVKQSQNGRKFKLILVAAQKVKESKLKEFLKKLNVHIPFIYDPFERSAKDFQVKKLPHTIYIGKSGRVVSIETGYKPSNHKRYIKIIKSLNKN